MERLQRLNASRYGMALTIGLTVALAGMLAVVALGLVPIAVMARGVAYAIVWTREGGRALAWIVALFSLITWPTVALAALLFVARSSHFQAVSSNLLRRTNKLKLWDVEVELSAESAKQLNASASETFEAYRAQANRELIRLARRYDVALNLRQFLRADLPLALPGGTAYTIPFRSATVRATLYIEDILFRDALWQVVDYVPNDGKPTSGRVFSQRFGIIGRAWRMGVHLAEDAAAHSESDMVRDWGMTYSEVQIGSRRRPSYMCLVLREKNAAGGWRDGAPIALFYVDTDRSGAFGPADQADAINAELARRLQEHPLLDKLQALRDELKNYAVEISTTS